MSEQELQTAMRDFSETGSPESGQSVLTQLCRLNQAQQGLKWLSQQQQLALHDRLTILKNCQFEVTVHEGHLSTKTSYMVFAIVNENYCVVIGSAKLRDRFVKATIYKDQLYAVNAYNHALHQWDFDDIGGKNHFVDEEQDPHVHCISVIDGQLLIGGNKLSDEEVPEGRARSRDTFFACHTGQQWKNYPGLDKFRFRKAIDAITHHGTQLLAWDNMILPKYLVEYDASEGISEAKYSQTINLPVHGTYERILFAEQFAEYSVYVSTTAVRMGAFTHIIAIDNNDFKSSFHHSIENYPNTELDDPIGLTANDREAIVFGSKKAQLISWRKAINLMPKTNAKPNRRANTSAYAQSLAILETAALEGLIKSEDSANIQAIRFFPNETDIVNPKIWCMLFTNRPIFIIGQLHFSNSNAVDFKILSSAQ